MRYQLWSYVLSYNVDNGNHSEYTYTCNYVPSVYQIGEIKRNGYYAESHTSDIPSMTFEDDSASMHHIAFVQTIIRRVK